MLKRIGYSVREIHAMLLREALDILDEYCSMFPDQQEGEYTE